MAYFSDGKNMFVKDVECYINAKQLQAGLDMLNVLPLAFIKPLQHLSICYISCSIFIYYEKKRTWFITMCFLEQVQNICLFFLEKIMKNEK